MDTAYSVFAGASGVVVCGAVVSPWAGDAGCSIGAVVVSMIESGAPRLDKYASAKDVSIKTIAATVVALLKNVEAPVLPNRV